MRWPRPACAIVALAALCGLPTGCVAASCSLPALTWMTGQWRDATDPARGEERWVATPTGALMGSSWLAPAAGKGFAETMTVGAQDDGAIAMRLRHFDLGLTRAWEERDAPMVFVASDCGARSAVFDGVGPRVGEHLTYQRDGRNLTITGDFLHHGTPDREVFHMVLGGD
jgi:hypothetical protein